MKNFKKILLTLALVYSSGSIMAVWPFQHRETSYSGESYYERDGLVGGTVETGVTAPFDILSGHGDRIGRTREQRPYERSYTNREDINPRYDNSEYSRKQMRRHELERLEKRTRAEERELKQLVRDIGYLERTEGRR